MKRFKSMLRLRKEYKPSPKFLYPEKEVLEKIRIAEHAYSVTPYGTVKDAAAKELQKLYKELEEIRNPKKCLFS